MQENLKMDKVDKTKLVLFFPYSVPFFTETEDEYKISPIIKYETVKYFYNNRDILKESISFVFKDEKTFLNTLYSYYSDQKIVGYKSVLAFNIDKLKALFPIIDQKKLDEFFLTIDELEKITNKQVDMSYENFERSLLVITKSMLVDNKNFFNTLISLDKKISVKDFEDIKEVKVTKFQQNVMQHVGFGNSNYFEFNDMKMIFDFGGLEPSDLSKYPLNAQRNYIILTHWHRDHFLGFDKLNIPNNSNTELIVQTGMLTLEHLSILFYLVDKVSKVNLIPFKKDYSSKPIFIIDDSIFIYASPEFDDAVKAKVATRTKAWFDLNSSSLVAIHATENNNINLYCGDQAYWRVEKSLRSFYNHYQFKNIALLHATHHGLLASDIGHVRGYLRLKVNNKELTMNHALISDSFKLFKENQNHKAFLKKFAKEVVVTEKKDIISKYDANNNIIVSGGDKN